MFAFVVFDLILQYLDKRLAGRNVSKMTYCMTVSGGMQNPNSINHVYFRCEFAVLFRFHKSTGSNDML